MDKDIPITVKVLIEREDWPNLIAFYGSEQKARDIYKQHKEGESEKNNSSRH